jgi:hypothetical protein
MDERHKRGFRRLALGLLIPWLVLWLVVFEVNLTAAHHEDAEMQRWDMSRFVMGEAKASQETIAFGSDMFVAAEKRGLAERRWMKRAKLYGPGVPIIVAVLSLLGFWVWRGFVPRSISN